jgi:hypothetical protein
MAAGTPCSPGVSRLVFQAGTLLGQKSKVLTRVYQLYQLSRLELSIPPGQIRKAGFCGAGWQVQRTVPKTEPAEREGCQMNEQPFELRSSYAEKLVTSIQVAERGAIDKVMLRCPKTLSWLTGSIAKSNKVSPPGASGCSGVSTHSPFSSALVSPSVWVLLASRMIQPASPRQAATSFPVSSPEFTR